LALDAAIAMRWPMAPWVRRMTAQYSAPSDLVRLPRRSRSSGIMFLCGAFLFMLVVVAQQHFASALPFVIGAVRRPLARRCGVARAAFDLGGIFSDETNIEVPKDVAAVVEGLKSSTEETLNQGISRLDIELPPAYKLGVEGDKRKSRLLSDKIESDDRAEVFKSDRELARLFVEMLQPIADGLCIAFRTKKLASEAKRIWKLEKTEGTVISFPEKLKSKSAFAQEAVNPAQFQNKLRELDCKCLVVVAPYLDQLRLVNEVSREAKDQMGILLLNARIHGVGRETLKIPPSLKRALLQTFPPSYHIRFLTRKNSMLFHMSTPGSDGVAPWILAQQRELVGGQPVTQEVMRWDGEPAEQAIEEAFAEYDSQERGIGDKLLDFVDKDKRAAA